MQFHSQTPGDQIQVLTVRANGSEAATLDANHQLAAVRLHFNVSIESAWGTTEQKFAQGRANQIEGSYPAPQSVAPMVKPTRPAGAALMRSSDLTRAKNGPFQQCATISSITSELPSKQASTDPSCRLRTYPVSPSAAAFAKVH